MDNKIRLQDVLTDFYSFLRDEGFSVHAQAIKKLLTYLHDNNIKMLKREMKSAVISGGAGSIRDIDFRTKEKNEYIANILSMIDTLVKEI